MQKSIKVRMMFFILTSTFLVPHQRARASDFTAACAFIGAAASSIACLLVLTHMAVEDDRHSAIMQKFAEQEKRDNKMDKKLSTLLALQQNNKLNPASNNSSQ